MRLHSLVLGLALPWSFASCESFEGINVSASAVGGVLTDLDIDNRETDGGEAFGGTVRVQSTSKEFPEFDVGFRIDAMYKMVDDTSGGISTDLDGFELGAAPMIRWKPPIGGETWTPYLELFGGVTHTWADLTLSGGGLSVSSNDSGAGVYYGGGAGFEFDIGESTGFHFGAEYVLLDYDFSVFEFDEIRAQGYVGLTHRF